MKKCMPTLATWLCGSSLCVATVEGDGTRSNNTKGVITFLLMKSLVFKWYEKIYKYAPTT